MELTAEEKKFLKKLGLRLRQIRESKGWTLEQTEEHGWHSWRHLQRIESGKNVTIVSLRRLSKVFKITVLDLLKVEE